MLLLRRRAFVAPWGERYISAVRAAAIGSTLADDRKTVPLLFHKNRFPLGGGPWLPGKTSDNKRSMRLHPSGRLIPSGSDVKSEMRRYKKGTAKGGRGAGR